MKVIFSIARTTIEEAIRRKVLLVIFFIAVLFLAIAPGLQVLAARQERSALVGMTLGIIQITSAVIAVILTVYLIPNEIERRTIYTILCKPVLRVQFLLGKYLGAVGALALMMSAMTLILIAVYAVQQHVYSWEQLAPLAKPPIMYFVQMSLLSAVAIFFSTFVTPLVNFFLTGGIYMVGTMFSSIFESYANNPNAPQVSKVIALLVNAVFPNFSRFNVQNPIINPGQVIENEFVYYLSSTVYGIVYISVLLILAMVIFDRREV